MGQGGRLAGVVVARYRQYPTKSGGACRVGVLEDITGAVHTRAFAIPEREHTVVTGTFKDIDLLAAPDSGSAKIFIHAGQKMDIFFFEVVPGFPQSLVKTAEGKIGRASCRERVYKLLE